MITVRWEPDPDYVPSRRQIVITAVGTAVCDAAILGYIAASYAQVFMFVALTLLIWDAAVAAVLYFMPTGRVHVTRRGKEGHTDA